MEAQLDLFADYVATRPESGHSGVESWRRERERKVEELGRKLSVPLHQQVEVWLASGYRLTGKLLLADEDLLLEGKRDDVLLCIGRATFRLKEVESIVRLA